jgi:murein DD-endopeptidase MepM/ murein hydrolase activator NlpD
MMGNTRNTRRTPAHARDIPLSRSRDATWLQLPSVDLYVAPEPLTDAQHAPEAPRAQAEETRAEEGEAGEVEAQQDESPDEANGEPYSEPLSELYVEPLSELYVEPLSEPYSEPLSEQFEPPAPPVAAPALLAVPRATTRLPAMRTTDAAVAAPPALFIPGSGVSMGQPFFKRRQRPLALRFTFFIVAACTILTGLFAAATLGGSDPVAGARALFQSITGSVPTTRQVSYHWYVAQPGDTIEGVADRFHVQIGGIYQLNHMIAGQELELGQKYKIPDDPFYGKTYRPVTARPTGNGSTVFGSDWWNSYAGNPLPGAFCSPAGPHPTDYQMVAPNPGANWVRGFSWYHQGIDLATTYGNPIVAAQRGMVIWAGWTNLGYGWSVVINHCNHVSTLYGHMAGPPLVHAGDNVEAGQQIGREGSTGWSTGPHLHFSLFWDNQYVDPLPYYGNSIANILRPCNCYPPK